MADSDTPRPQGDGAGVARQHHRRRRLPGESAISTSDQTREKEYIQANQRGLGGGRRRRIHGTSGSGRRMDHGGLPRIGGSSGPSHRRRGRFSRWCRPCRRTSPCPGGSPLRSRRRRWLPLPGPIPSTGPGSVSQSRPWSALRSTASAGAGSGSPARAARRRIDRDSARSGVARRRWRRRSRSVRTPSRSCPGTPRW